jgi:hypothetical protein
MVSACRNARPNQITTSSAARFSQWRAGSSSGLPPILPDSLPKAIEPAKVIAPIRMPVDLHLVDGLLGADELQRRVDVAREADQAGRQADQAVHQRDQLGHLRHLHLLRGIEADRAADDQRGDPAECPPPTRAARHGGQHRDQPCRSCRTGCRGARFQGWRARRG